MNVGKTKVDKNVYNGKNKLIVGCCDFTTKSDVKECLSMLKPKRCEGYNRIPVCAIYNIEPFFYIFEFEFESCMPLHL